MSFFIHGIFIGMFATLMMDIFAFIRFKFFHIASLNYRLVGRWMISWKDRKFKHHHILHSDVQKFEVLIGWIIHYIIGIIWAIIFLFLVQYFDIKLIFISSLTYALFTSLIPFIIMQPAFGLGFFASKTPNPKSNIFNSLMSHTAFGIGLYFSHQVLHL